MQPPLMWPRRVNDDASNQRESMLGSDDEVKEKKVKKVGEEDEKRELTLRTGPLLPGEEGSGAGGAGGCEDEDDAAAGSSVASWLRFIEYSFSAAVMIVAISLQVGIMDAWMLFVLAALTWVGPLQFLSFFFMVFFKGFFWFSISIEDDAIMTTVFKLVTNISSTRR